jgi:hypothetical protein
VSTLTRRLAATSANVSSLFVMVVIKTSPKLSKNYKE